MNVGNALALCAVTTEASVLLSQSIYFTFLSLSVFQNENWKASIILVRPHWTDIVEVYAKVSSQFNADRSILGQQNLQI
jgi:hypothetical protein